MKYCICKQPIDVIISSFLLSFIVLVSVCMYIACVVSMRILHKLYVANGLEPLCDTDLLVYRAITYTLTSLKSVFDCLDLTSCLKPQVHFLS